MASYKFVTHWRFDAPLERVWTEIYESARWPEWWRAVTAVTELTRGNKAGVGSVRRYEWRTALPYRLSFDMKITEVQEFLRLEGLATGELSGRGCWQFSRGGAGTHVQYDWEVETTKLWMHLLAPLARPLFAWNHDTVMRWGYEGLVQRLKEPAR